MIDLEEEYRCGFYVDKSRKKLWDIELEMLEIVKRICVENSLEWFLIAGSAIGAVRHKGFIPWDDDIDLGMERKDFERFVISAKKELPDRYELQYGLDLEKKEFHYFCRIRDKQSTGIIRQEYKHHGVKGVFIEIYPFDSVPSNKLMRTIHWKVSMAYIEVLRNRIYSTTIGKSAKVLKYIHLHNTTGFIYASWLKWCTKYNDREREYKLVDTVSIPGYSASEVDLFDAIDISSTFEVPFETTTVSLAIGNDKCLKRAYGNYMELPPEEERGIHHQSEVFYDPFVPYTEYDGTKTVEEFFEGRKGKI